MRVVAEGGGCAAKGRWTCGKKHDLGALSQLPLTGDQPCVIQCLESTKPVSTVLVGLGLLPGACRCTTRIFWSQKAHRVLAFGGKESPDPCPPTRRAERPRPLDFQCVRG